MTGSRGRVRVSSSTCLLNSRTREQRNFSRQPREIARGGSAACSGCWTSPPNRPSSGWPTPCPTRGQGNGVIRATTLIIVLTLTATPTATSLCIAICGVQTSPGAEGASCHHEGMTTSGTLKLVTKGHTCDEFLQGTPFVREDLQRVASGFAPDHAVVIGAYHSLGWKANHRLLTGPWVPPHSFPPSDSTVLRL